jgi:hypothetical protein
MTSTFPHCLYIPGQSGVYLLYSFKIPSIRLPSRRQPYYRPRDQTKAPPCPIEPDNCGWKLLLSDERAGALLSLPD